MTGAGGGAADIVSVLAVTSVMSDLVPVIVM